MADALFDIEPEPPPDALRLTERDMLNLLHKRYDQKARNGITVSDRYVCAEHVRARAGFDCGTADFMAMDTWRSKLALHGAEVKVSRSDWLRELKQPEKSAPFREWCTYWWLAVPDASVARPDEMPEGWGLLIARGTRLVTRVQAPRKPWTLTAASRSTPLMAARTALYPDSLALMPVEFVASLLRAVAKTTRQRAS